MLLLFQAKMLCKYFRGKFAKEDLPSLEDPKPSKWVQPLIFGLQSKDFLVVPQPVSGLLLKVVTEVREKTAEPVRHKYTWPRFVVAAIILAVVLAAIWMSFEIRRAQRIRELNSSQAIP